MIKISRQLFVLFILAIFTACSLPKNDGGSNKLFKLVSSDTTNITFSNDLTFDPDFNIYQYRNFYNGGGVAVGDINNDGLQDLYFTSNMESNRLYLNKGGMVFEDITEKAGVAGSREWSTGVSMADVNGDGLLDIYVCNAGMVQGDDKQNELFINNGDSTFTERAEEFGIADPALSVHGSFFDYDQDGDLDLYLVNNSFRAIGSFDLEQNNRNDTDPMGGDKLYRNEGGHFVEVTEEAGIYSSEIGFALGISVADINRDGWPDMYISNDFFERDYLYLNNQDGTFREVLEKQINSISAASMGADVADLSGDGYPEIFVTDMLPEPESRLKKVTTFDDWEGYRNYVENDYHHQFTRNTLQLNNTDGTFSEVGRWAGVEATDWSWGANIADLDLDGRRDIFVANGIYQDITNLDYLETISRGDMVRRIVSDRNVDFKKLIEMVPSTPISNYAFHNKGNMQFADSSKSWGLDQPGFSNGSAYGDLDNDGDLDLVINNLNSNASVYENRATEQKPDHWLMIALKGSGENTNAIGAQLTAWAGQKMWFAEQMPIRGFQSTMDSRVHIGLGNTAKLDSLQIRWPEGKYTMHRNLPVDTLLTFDAREINTHQITKSRSETSQKSSAQNPLLHTMTSQSILNWKHQENEFVDFNRDRLLFHMRSTEGPPICKGDANGDDREDIYLGGAKGQSGALFQQTPNGRFTKIENPSFANDAASEDTDCAWFDANGDGADDLYVTSGGNEFPASSSALGDRLYINNGLGEMVRSQQPLPSIQYKPTSTVQPADYDGDGDIDLFVGVRLQPFSVGMNVRGYLLKNNGQGKFTDVTEEQAPALLETGMITDSKWGDLNGDGSKDLMVAGEWMPLMVFINEDGKLTRNTANNLSDTNGWWHSLLLHDLDNDGDLDFVAGNHGLNSRFEASKEQPAELWAGDLDENGTREQVLAIHKSGEAYPMALRHNLIDQIPSLESDYPDYESFAGESVTDIFSEEMLNRAEHSETYRLGSVVGWNQGDGSFKLEKLPMRAQLSPIYGLYVDDLNGDGQTEIIAGGNLHHVKPEVGRYAASYGVVMTVYGDSLETLDSDVSGFKVSGEVRNIIRLNRPGENPILLITRNDDQIKLFEITGKTTQTNSN